LTNRDRAGTRSKQLDDCAKQEDPDTTLTLVFLTHGTANENLLLLVYGKQTKKKLQLQNSQNVIK
jgi:hypothetical protein